MDIPRIQDYDTEIWAELPEDERYVIEQFWIMSEKEYLPDIRAGVYGPVAKRRYGGYPEIWEPDPSTAPPEVRKILDKMR